MEGFEMRNGPIVILGGYGQVGRSLTALLLEHTQAKLVISGRRVEAAQAFISQLDDPEGRLEARYADASKPETLRKAFQDASLVIVAATAPQYAANIANACLDGGCDYFDILEMVVGTQALMAMNPAVQDAGRLFVTQGGLAPGLPAAFARLACGKLDRCQRMRLGLALSFKTMERTDQVIEVFKYVTQHPPHIYRSGSWQKRSLGKDRINLDYGLRYGTRASSLIDLAEMRDLPDQLEIEELGVYGAVPNAFLNYLMSRILVFLDGIRPQLGWGILARIVFNASKYMKGDLPGYAILLEADGQKDGMERTVRVLLDHEDNYYSTAAAMMVFIQQYLAGVFEGMSGVHMMGHIIEPEKAVKDLAVFGLQTQTTL
jgi:hypothetical protein